MNERIRTLAGQALDKVVPYTWTKLDYDEVQKLQEYFAELIVKECAYFSMVATDDHYDVEALYKHFGVEE